MFVPRQELHSVVMVISGSVILLLTMTDEIDSSMTTFDVTIGKCLGLDALGLHLAKAGSCVTDTWS